ncbi:GNAT family acetyltransferase [Natrialba magadii ATCC 43099]|uniref:GNAT family acetyltransferase n=1 Tax=Natrialba magadii (strain ATCC 43099 / DSM 3394 / CCM 3739 / CIP 104546 / IAM 13178 / JCM 8861 / NBRC 102185 / NCIMB 2190 / MS3) TaxID=547559 RepID=D3SS06_NATMM|nr:GNAT family acetyltransferase [Natrialba magadii ATCC 43099]ELY27784.1 N-acetyltransferase GCN5 [Natrialba magadii ATCC 43099]
MSQDLTYELLGWPPGGPKLPLDHKRFSYAGKFVMTNTGKAVARDGETIVAAIAFNEDRTDEHTLWLRYVTVARDRRGEGIGPELVSLVRDHAVERGYERIRIAVNNPFAYEALYRAGFTYTGETTGIAELVLEYQPSTPGENGTTTERERDTYQDGLDEFRDRDLSGDETAFLESRVGSEPPDR